MFCILVVADDAQESISQHLYFQVICKSSPNLAGRRCKVTDCQTNSDWLDLKLARLLLEFVLLYRINGQVVCCFCYQLILAWTLGQCYVMSGWPCLHSFLSFPFFKFVLVWSSWRGSIRCVLWKNWVMKYKIYDKSSCFNYWVPNESLEVSKLKK